MDIFQHCNTHVLMVKYSITNSIYTLGETRHNIILKASSMGQMRYQCGLDFNVVRTMYDKYFVHGTICVRSVAAIDNNYNIIKLRHALTDKDRNSILKIIRNKDIENILQFLDKSSTRHVEKLGIVGLYMRSLHQLKSILAKSMTHILTPLFRHLSFKNFVYIGMTSFRILTLTFRH